MRVERVPARRRLLEARRRKPWHELPDDDENDQRQREARSKMRLFDALGPLSRAAAAQSRFDALDPDRVRRRYGCATDFADAKIDERVAGEIARTDDSYSGSTGPAFLRGI